MGRLTVGDLRGQPQWPGRGRGPELAAAPVRGSVVPPLPPSKRGKGCCRKGCRGCPWAESVRAAMQRPAKP